MIVIIIITGPRGKKTRGPPATIVRSSGSDAGGDSIAAGEPAARGDSND